MIAAVFISDRGDLYLPGCIASYEAAGGPPKYHIIDDSDHRLGMAGAVREAWQWALDEGVRYLVHVEEDFLFTAPLDLFRMARILNSNQHLAQVALKRQPWSNTEVDAGGFMEANPDAYTQCFNLSGTTGQHLNWVEHDTLFTLNPCLIPRRTLELGWAPGALGAERAITDACLRAGMRFAYYGRIEDEPRCEHVGHTRAAGHRW